LIAPLLLLGALDTHDNGFLINFYPWQSEEEEAEAWETNMSDDWVATQNYELVNTGLDQARAPRAGDQHTMVDRFSDNLPKRLYGKRFLKKLREHCQAGQGKKSRYHTAERLYCNTVAYIEAYLERKVRGYQ
jgi:hypothetical protein